MKRFLGFLVLAVFFVGCDDGDLEEVSFEFDETVASPCNSTTGNFFIYKTTDQRALILKLAENNFTRNVTADSLDIGYIELEISPTGNQLIYRTYNDNVTATTLCPTSGVPASYPVVTEERIAAGGKMRIRTTVIKSEETAEGATSITQYLHTISFSDVTFNTPDGNQRNESLPSVTYRTPAPRFIFDELSALKTCTEGDYKLIYKNNSNQAMMLRLNEADATFLFSNDITAPKVRYLNAENKLTHSFYSRTDITPFTDAYFCATPTPALPAVNTTWKGNDGVEDVSGIIEVVTEQIDDNEYKHTITLKNVTMARNSQNFRLRSNFVFGSIETTAP